MTPQGIIHFWTEEAGEAKWFESDDALDSEIAQRFGEIYRSARDGRLSDWEDTAEGALALLLLLDQFPRNMFRGKAEAFATDAIARGVADRAIDRGFDMDAPVRLRPFFYLPFMHSEAAADQNRCVDLVSERLGEQSEQYAYALLHRDIVAKFGRFPGRNVALGRQSTPEEREFLASNPSF